jgi:lipocalin
MHGRYADTFVAKTFERNCYCGTADYKLNADNTVSLLNSETLNAVDGPFKNITGTATTTDVPGQLELNLDGPPSPGSYWIVQLGPINSDGLYDYSVVTDNKSLTLFVLARDVDTYNENYDTDVQAYLSANGFTRFFHKPVRTVQLPTCLYAPSPF